MQHFYLGTACVDAVFCSVIELHTYIHMSYTHTYIHTHILTDIHMYMIFEGLQSPFMSKTACQNMSKYIKTCQLQFWLITLCFLTMWRFGPKGGPPCQPRHPAFYATNPAIDNYCGNDAWDQTCNSQTWSTSQLAGISDAPPLNGQLSDALQQRLAEEDISDVEVVVGDHGAGGPAVQGTRAL